jgi:hypothetical protein
MVFDMSSTVAEAPGKAKDLVEEQPADCVSVEGTVFLNQQARTKECVLISANGLRSVKSASSKKSAPWLKLAIFGDEPTKKNCLRNDANVIAVTGAEFDYDDGELAFEPAVARLTEAGVKAIAYTSASHTPGKPKWRILLPFNKPYQSTKDEMKAYRKNAVLRVETILDVKADHASYNLSQAFYFGPVKQTEEYYQVLETPGEFIDILHDLKAGLPEPVSSNPFEGLAGSLKELGAGGDVEGWTAGIVAGNPLHPNVRDLAAHYAAVGVRQRDARAIIETLLGVSHAAEGSVNRELKDIERTLSNAYDKFDRGPVNTGTHINPGWPDTPMTSRPRLYGNHILKGYLTMLNGPGGVSKSVFTVSMAIGLAIGRDLLKIARGDPIKPRRVLMLNNEDCVNELTLRLEAAMQCYDLTEDERALVKENLKPQSGYIEQIRLASENETGALVKTNLVEEIIDYCLANSIEAIYFDPLVSLHGSNENDNTVMDAVIAILREVAGGGGVGIYFAHHSRKGSSADSVDENARGATALVNAVRASYGLMGMTKKEAEKFVDVDESDRGAYVRLDSGKTNYAPKATDAVWFELKSIAVTVADWETGKETTESVGVPVPVTLLPDEKTSGSAWPLFKVMDAVRKAGVTSPFVLTGENGEILSKALSNDDDPLKKTALHDRFRFFPDVGGEPRVVALPNENLRCWQTRGEKNRKKFHYEVVA